MEAYIKQLLTEPVLQQAIQCWSTNGDTAKLLGDVENFVYECQSETHCWILRLTHSSHRTESQLLAELDWQQYLNQQQIRTCIPLRSRQQHWVETIPLAVGFFYLTAFEKVPGTMLPRDNQAEWTPDRIRRLGQLIGKMHTCTKTYQPSTPEQVRPQWLEDDIIYQAATYLPAEEAWALRQLQDSIALFQQFHQGPDHFGLIHADIHPGNFFIQDSELIFFDFDDSAYHWFAFDLAVPLHAMSSLYSSAEHRPFLADFWQHLITGYQQENHLADWWQEHLPDFLRFRDRMLYTFLHKKWDFSQLNERQKTMFTALKERMLDNRAIFEP